MLNFGVCNTGYEFSRVYLKELTAEEVKNQEEAIGVQCDKCGTFKSEKWYEEKIINNYLSDYRTLCEKCK
jgi:hypothetical protein